MKNIFLGVAIVVAALAVSYPKIAESKRNKSAAPAVPIGTVIAFAGDVAAGREPDGWLLCDGRTVSVDRYSALYAVLQGRYGRVNATDGTFPLPDYRGVFLRGVANGATTDPERSLRQAHTPGASSSGDKVGSRQDDQFRQHTHVAPLGAGGSNPGKYLPIDAKPKDEGITPFIPTEPSGGPETRPVNVAVHYLIKT